MTSDDVVASLNRWGKQSDPRQGAVRPVADGARPGTRTRWRCSSRRSRASCSSRSPCPNNFAAIYPKEIAEKFAADGQGQGVHRHRALQARRVEARPAHPDGPLRRLQGAQRDAQRLRRGARPPTSTRSAGSRCRTWRRRVAQVETGELDFADDLEPDAYDRLRRTRTSRPDHRPSRTTGWSRVSTRRKA